MKWAAKFRYLLFILLLALEFRLYDTFNIAGRTQAISEVSSTPMIPVMLMLVLMGATLFAERYFNKDKYLPFNMAGKAAGLIVAALYYFYLLPIPVRRSSEATLFLFCIAGFLLASLVRDFWLLARRKRA